MTFPQGTGRQQVGHFQDIGRLKGISIGRKQLAETFQPGRFPIDVA